LSEFDLIFLTSMKYILSDALVIISVKDSPRVYIQ